MDATRRLAATPVFALIVLACGEGVPLDPSTGPGLPSGSSDDGGGTDDGNTEDSSSDSGGDEGPGTACVPECGGDEVCVDGSCCPASSACGDVCCDEGIVCSFAQCVAPGEACIDATECPDGFYCEYALGDPADAGEGGMCQGGISLATGKCLPAPPSCEPGVEPDPDALDCLPECEVVPRSIFAPEPKFTWAEASVQTTPMVIQLDDDDCNGVVDERDIPEIVFASFAGTQTTSNATLHALSVVDGVLIEKWSTTPTAPSLQANPAIAVGDIDGVPGSEIVVCSDNTAVRAFRADGMPMWVSATTGFCDHPSLADLDQDGFAEVITEGAVLEGATGITKFPLTLVGESHWREHVIAADVTGDTVLDLVTPSRVFDYAGRPIITGAPRGTYPAVADFDGDGQPEVVSVMNVGSGNIHELEIWRPDPAAPNGFEAIRTGVDINGPLSPTACPVGTWGRVSGGGPPTIADFNGDGTPDVGVAGGVGYAVFDGEKLLDPTVASADTLAWINPSQDCSSAFTGSSVFDFDGNGTAEVIYADEETLRIYRGSDGFTLFEDCNTSNTAHEYPVIADVDNDGHADIVVVSNDHVPQHACPGVGGTTRGVRIYGDSEGLWVRTRRVWNQHAYHVTNVEEDGSIPETEQANWNAAGLNDFRKNAQPEGEWSAPDLVPSVIVSCEPGNHELRARVRNIGRAAVLAGVPVSFYAGDPGDGGERLGGGVTSKVLYPAEAQDIVLDAAIPDDIASGAMELWIEIEADDATDLLQECRSDNNVAHAEAACDVAG